MEIRGRRVLVTGAGRGLGRALVPACARAGAAEVLAGARDLEKLDALRSGASGLGAKVIPLELDVTREREVAAAAARAGRVDILINNAGAIAFGGVFKGELQAIRQEIEVNYFGVLHVVRAFVPEMVRHGDGLIVNVASQLAKVSLPAIGTYCATRAALLSLSQAMRGDLSGSGVRVITVLPGALDTDMSRGFEIPKMAPSAAAEEILEAIRQETAQVPIGDEARATMAGLAADPAGVERAFARFKA